MNNPDNYFPELNIPFLKDFIRYQIIKEKFDSLPLKNYNNEIPVMDVINSIKSNGYIINSVYTIPQ